MWRARTTTERRGNLICYHKTLSDFDNDNSVTLLYIVLHKQRCCSVVDKSNVLQTTNTYFSK